MWQVTTIIQPALRHLGTSHFWKVLYNKIRMGQIRWPIFLFLMYMLVLTEKTSIFPKSNMFWILVFSCPKMTLITIFTRMTLLVVFGDETRNRRGWRKEVTWRIVETSCLVDATLPFQTLSSLNWRWPPIFNSEFSSPVLKPRFHNIRFPSF